MRTNFALFAVCCGLFPAAMAATPSDGSVLPFPLTPSASKAGPTLQESTHQRRVEPDRLPKGALNVLIVLIDDAGFGVPDTFGGFAHTPTLSKLRDDTTSRMPEFTAPAVGNANNTITMEVETNADGSGVLYAMGGSGGGLACYMDKGFLIFEYNLMIIDRSIARSAEKIAPGKHIILVEITLKAPKPGAPADVVLSVDGKEVARATVRMTVPAAFTASESFDVGTDLGSTVSRDYYERRPFKFSGEIGTVKVALK